MQLVNIKNNLHYGRKHQKSLTQSCQLPTISRSNDVVAKPQWRLTNAVAANIEGVCEGVYRGIHPPLGGVGGGCSVMHLRAI